MGKNLDLAVSKLEKQFGKGVLFHLESDERVKIPVIPTGIFSLDRALGVGGFPRGRIIEIFGPESSGKTTIALQVIGQAQKQRPDAKAAVVDAEHALDPCWARKLGVDTTKLLICQPDNGEQALEVTEGLVRSGEMDIILVDSVAALVPKAELEGQMGDAQMGLQARLMSQAMRKLTAIVHKSDTCLIFINQIRMKLGVLFGNPETTAGGNALKFYSSVRLDVRRSGVIKDGDTKVAAKTKVKVIKNKVAAPFREAEIDIVFDKGIDVMGDLVDVAASLGVIEKSGSWFNFAGERLGQGRDNVVALLESNPELTAKVRAATEEAL